MGLPIYKVSDVAKYFRSLTNVEEGDLLSNLKLQKLCYYAQGIALATRGQVLFSEDIEAWQHGPVVPQLYREYAENGSKPISPPEDFSSSEIFHPADIELMNDVYDQYGQFSAWKLRNMTHEEAPWINAYKNPSSKVISLEAIHQFFSGEVDESYRTAYHAKIQAA